MERKRLFVGGQLHGTELPVGHTRVTVLQHRLPEDFPTDPLRIEEYRTLRLTRDTPEGKETKRFRVLRGIKRSKALRMTLRERDRFWAAA
ncbi:hypothetical protein [Cupriavidus plantarum]|uniref:hypothetical protein n=1 Tax=Cupriavidus plantarum TaxID=942865 RepID=UPI00339D94EB